MKNTLELRDRVKELVDNSGEEVLHQVYELLQAGPKAKWHNESLRKYNEEIDEAMKRMDEGHFVTHEKLEKESELWFSNEK